MHYDPQRLSILNDVISVGKGGSIASFAIRGLELIELRFALRGEFSLGSLAIQIVSRAVVKRGAQIYPDLNSRIALVLLWFGRFGQAKPEDQAKAVAP